MAETNTEGGAGDSGEAQQGQFGIQKIYVKDISFETPNSPDIFQQEWSPSVNMDVANSAKPLSDKLFEVVLSVTVTVRFAEKIVYLAEVQQAGIFHIEGFAKPAVNRILATLCPNILFQFAREVVADLAMRGGFPQLLLAPMNFDALYAQHLRDEAARAPADTDVKH